MDEELKRQIDRFVTMLEVLEGIELTDTESKFLKWLSGWNKSTVDNFISIIKKARKRKRGKL